MLRKLFLSYSLYAKSAALVLAVLPFVYLLSTFSSYAVDLPVWDEWWSIVPLLQKYYSGTLHFSDLWAQHNEHRLLFPKLLMLGLATASGFDVRWQMVASIGFALLFYGCIGLHLWRNRRALRLEGRWYWLWVLTSYAVFSLRQHENWFWGFQVQWYMNVCGVALGAYGLTNEKLNPRTFGLLLACGLFSLFSLSAGALFWCLVPVFWLLMHWRAQRISRVWWYTVVWYGIFGLLLFVYFLNMHRGNYPGGLLRFLDEPGDFVRYVLLYLGGLLTQMGSTDWSSLMVGTAGLAIFAAGGVRLLLRVDLEQRRASLFFLFLGCYAVGCALITAIGRSGFGVEQASSSRYTTISLLLWIAVLFILFEGLPRKPFGRWIRKVLGAAAAVLLCASFSLVCYSGYSSLPYIRYASYVYNQVRYALEFHPDPAVLQNISNNPALVVKEARPFLKKKQLSVFRPDN